MQPWKEMTGGIAYGHYLGPGPTEVQLFTKDKLAPLRLYGGSKEVFGSSKIF